MNRLLCPLDRLIPLLAIALACAFPPAARAATGKLIDARTVAFSAGAIAAMSEREPEIGSILSAIKLERITYEVDGIKVAGYLAQPNTPGPHPCLIWNRGGNRAFGAWNDRMAAIVLGRAASWGYVVVATQYRGNGGSEGQEEFGGADVADVLGLLPVLESLPFADARRIGIYGQSRGGMMTYLALSRSDRFAAAVVDAGMADLADSVSRRSEMEQVAAELIPNWTTERDAAIAARSAVQWPERLASGTPILLLHGTADDRVDISQAERMAAALQAKGHPHELVRFSGGDHALTAHRSEADQRIRAWFDQHLRAR